MTEQEVESQAYFDSYNSVLRWISNDRVVPREVLEGAGYDKEFVEMCARVEDRENIEFIKEYAKKQREFEADTSPEAMEAKRERAAERRAAFGEGVEVVDVFSGISYRT